MAGSQGTEPGLHGSLTSGNLTLTEMQDGTLRILHNGIPCKDQCWKPMEMHIAQLKFEELRARLTAGPEYQTEVNQQSESPMHFA